MKTVTLNLCSGRYPDILPIRLSVSDQLYPISLRLTNIYPLIPDNIFANSLQLKFQNKDDEWFFAAPLDYILINQKLNMLYQIYSPRCFHRMLDPYRRR